MREDAALARGTGESDTTRAARRPTALALRAPLRRSARRSGRDGAAKPLARRGPTAAERGTLRKRRAGAQIARFGRASTFCLYRMTCFSAVGQQR